MEMKHRRLLDGLKHFTDFDAAELDALAGVLRPRTLPANARLFRHGEAADGCYIVAEGRVRVALGKDGEGEQLAILGGGEVLGQMALLDGGKRSATCTALEPTTVLYLGRDEFDLLCRGGSSFALKFLDALTRMLVAQLRYANRRLLALAHKNAQPGEAHARGALRDVARNSFSCNLGETLDEMEYVTPDGLKR
jgi:CRP/FNR family cyclic AMP-dependent transcriptional regulator